jgi:hypothetical protein
MEPIFYTVEDLELILYPITINECTLDIEIDTSRNWYIQSVSITTTGNKVVQLDQGDWIEREIIASVYADRDLCNEITKTCRGEND